MITMDPLELPLGILDPEEGSEGIAIISEKDLTNIFERLVNYISLNGNMLLHYKWIILNNFPIFFHMLWLECNRLWNEKLFHTNTMMQLSQNATWDSYEQITANILPIIVSCGNVLQIFNSSIISWYKFQGNHRDSWCHQRDKSTDCYAECCRWVPKW